MILEALSHEFRTGCPWELYAEVVNITKSVEELYKKSSVWKVNLEKKGVRVNMKKSKFMFSGLNMKTLINCDV